MVADQMPRGLYTAWLDAQAQQSMDFMKQFPAGRLLAGGREQSLSIYSTTGRANSPDLPEWLAALRIWLDLDLG